MGEQVKTKSSKMRAMILAVVRIILVLTGVAIATVHSALRGSGLGTISLIIGRCAASRRCL